MATEVDCRLFSVEAYRLEPKNDLFAREPSQIPEPAHSRSLPHRPVDDPSDPAARRWTASPSAKEKSTVQRAVTALLDELAPERAPRRAERLSVRVERHRTPNGCVLQAATAAVSVSWFAEPAPDAALGQLRVIVWRGVVSRRGSPPRPEGATMVRELALYPIERPTGDCVWRATDGTEFDTPGLAAHCVALLEEQIGPDRSGDAG